MARSHDVWMRCPDGVRLATRIWHPDPACPAGKGPWPVLLMRQPYGRAIASTPTYADPSWYAAQGFLVAIQDVRGRGDSEGSFGGFAQEAADGATAVRWARGLPGGDGRVATYGFSYQGATQLLNSGGGGPAAAGDPDPFPDCLVPAMTGLDERGHWASEGGAHWWALGLGWALQLAAEGCRRRDDGSGWLEIRRQLEQGTFLREGAALLERLDPAGMGWQWLRNDPASSEGWQVHPVAEPLLRRPMLLVGGWHDPHLRGVLDLLRRARRAGGRPSLVIGAWTHLDWRGGIDDLQLAFLRRHLPAAGAPPANAERGSVPDPGEGRIALQFPDGCWALHSHDPPQPELASRGWSLASGGLAAIRSDEGRLVAPVDGGGNLRIVHDPWRPAPGRGGHLGLDAGLAERGDLDGRADVACFTTAPLTGPLELVGIPRLELVVAADQDGFDLCAALSHLPRQGGGVQQITTGVARFRGEGCRSPRLRRLNLQPLALRLEEGDRLRLSLAGAAWPQIAVNPGDGSVPLEAPGPRHRVIGLDLQLAVSRLWLTPLTGAD
jgi:putative CocE/NonD family hydrolase